MFKFDSLVAKRDLLPAFLFVTGTRGDTPFLDSGDDCALELDSVMDLFLAIGVSFNELERNFGKRFTMLESVPQFLAGCVFSLDDSHLHVLALAGAHTGTGIARRIRAPGIAKCIEGERALLLAMDSNANPTVTRWQNHGHCGTRWSDRHPCCGDGQQRKHKQYGKPV